MSRPASKRTSNRLLPTDPDIQSLQTKLLQSLNSAFDPTAVDKTDDFFLAKDYVFETPLEPLSNAFKSAKNPYQTLTDKARDYVEKAQAERPARAKTTISMNKRNDTFLTYLDMEKKEIIDNPPPPVQEEEELPYVSDENIIGDITAGEKMDDLEELRRMIRQTKKEMGDYGRELLNLKNDILGINSFAAQELGFMVNQDLLTNIEDTIGTLKNKNMYTHKKKDSKLKNLKSFGEKIEQVNEKKVYKRAPSLGTTTVGSLGTTGGPANFRVKSGVSKAMRPPSYRGPVKKG